MDPITISSLVIGSLALVAGFISNVRIRSRCRTDNLELSFQKRYNEDLATDKQIDKKMKQLQDLFTSTSDYDSSSE